MLLLQIQTQPICMLCGILLLLEARIGKLYAHAIGNIAYVTSL